MSTLTAKDLHDAIDSGQLAALGGELSRLAPQDVAALLDASAEGHRTIAFRLLPKDDAVQVFDDLTPGAQAALINSLGTAEVADAFNEMDPDDRAELLDELPANVAKALIRSLSPANGRPPRWSWASAAAPSAAA